MQPSSAYDEEDISFDESILSPPYRFRFCIDQAKKHFGKLDNSLSLCDVGCGNGLLLKLFNLEGLHTFAVEKNKNKFKSEISGDINDDITEIEESSKNIVTLIQVLEHNVNVEEFIEQCYSKVKPGGLFIWSVPIENLLADFDHKFIFDYYDIFRLNSLLSKKFEIYTINKFSKFASDLNIFASVVFK